jgi:predicted DNA-binding transcriptional regulator AlpA
MPRQSALPPTLPPRLLTRDAAAAYVCLSPNSFDVMVKDGRMPRPRRLGPARLAWDLRELDAAVDHLPIDSNTPTVDETWSDVDATQTPAIC